MLNIISLVLAVISVALTISTEFNTFLTKNIKDNSTLYLMGFFIVVILLFHRINIKNDKILTLQSDLRSDTKELWKNYSELNEFYRQKTLISGLQRFVNSTPQVLSVQRYKYKLYKSNGHLIISINGDYSYIKEGEDLNTVSQGYFRFTLKDLKLLVSASIKTQHSEVTGNIVDNDYKDLIKLYTSWGGELQQKNCDTYTDADSLKYHLLKQMQYNIEKFMNESVDLGFNEQQIKQLDGRKSGIDIAMFILKAWLNIKTDVEIFNYKGTSDTKKLRMYSNIEVANKVGEKYVFVLAHYADSTWSEEKQKDQVQIDTQSFIKFIESEHHFIS